MPRIVCYFVLGGWLPDNCARLDGRRREAEEELEASDTGVRWDRIAAMEIVV